MMEPAHRVVLGLLVALLLASAGVVAAEPPPMVPPSVAPPDRRTLQKLHDHDQTEIAMGKVAEAHGSSRSVRDFGRRLAADHAGIDRRIDEYLRKRGTDISALATTTSVDPDHEVLATKAGLDFDRAFAQQTVRDLQAALDLLASERLATSDDPLRFLYDDLATTMRADKRAAEEILAASARS
jgi:predicted outer membrane protein